MSQQSALVLQEQTVISGAESQKINLLILVDEFHCNGAGTEQHIHFLLKRLPRDRFRVHFVVLSQIYDFDMSLITVQPHLLREGTSSNLVGLGQRVQRLKAYIQRQKIDVVHAFSLTSEFYALLASRLAGRARVLGVRRNTGYWHTRLTLWMQRLLTPWGATYVANCNAAKEAAAKNEWIPSRRCTVIRNPVRLDRLREGIRDLRSTASLGIHPGEKVVGIVATVRPIKDHETFLQAGRIVLDEHPQTRFLIVGWAEPKIASNLKSLVLQLDMERQVSWIGAVPNVFSVLPHFDVGVLASRSEAFSNALLEYAVAGVPTVATDVGGSREIVEEDKTGFLVPPQSPKLMAAKISQLLADDRLGERFGEEAQQRANACFSQEKVLREYVALYFALAHRRQPA